MDRITSMTAFAAVVATGSFSGAAQRLKMSPAMVTNHVRALEERLGARLLNRTTRKVSLTEAGRDYHERCIQILAQIEAADSRVAALTSAPRGTLRVNASTVLCHGLATLIGDFVATYPEITVELTATDRMVDPVEEGFTWRSATTRRRTAASSCAASASSASLPAPRPPTSRSAACRCAPPT